MSIENDIKRIADALEILAHVPPAAPEVKAPESKKPGKPAAPVPADDLPPGIEEATNIEAVNVKTAGELRDFAQKFVTKANEMGESKMQDLVAYIKNDICAKFSPKEPKLVKIPADKLQIAAQMIYDYAFEKGIIL